MAKAKKQETGKKRDAAPAEGAKKAGHGKSAAKGASRHTSKSAAPTGGGGVPLIDTDLAAATAAKMLVSRAASGAAQGATSGPAASAGGGSSESEETGEKRETSTFKQLKQNLSKPQSGGLGSVLGGPVAGKKGNTPFGGNQQVARNQTFGADVNRSGVPRRTGG